MSVPAHKSCRAVPEAVLASAGPASGGLRRYALPEILLVGYLFNLVM